MKPAAAQAIINYTNGCWRCR